MSVILLNNTANKITREIFEGKLRPDINNPLDFPGILDNILSSIIAGEETVAGILKRNKISHSVYYERLHGDAEFAALIQSAYIKRRESIGEKSEVELLKRVKGYKVLEVQTEKGKTSRGDIDIVRTTERHIAAHDATLIWSVKAAFQERYGDKLDVSATIKLESREDYDRLLAEVNKKAKKLGVELPGAPVSRPEGE